MKKMMIAALAAAGIAGMVCTGCSKKSESASGSLTLEKGILKVGMEVGYPPFEYFDADGKTPIGFDVSLGQEVSKRLGLEVQFVDTAWDGIFAGIDTDKYDCIMSAVTITDERKAKYDFSRPYIGNGQSMVLTKDSKVTAKTPEELSGLKVAYQAETTSDIYMTKLADNGLKFEAEEYDKVMNCFDDLKLGRVDAVVADSLVSVDYVNKPDSPFVIAWKADPTEFFGVCIKKGNTKLVDAVNKAITDMYADGTLVKISNDVFGSDMVSGAETQAAD
ncbi:MAG: transporter substrate-binding domain-containing protein [Treponema sp.]|nr:transporter substrate-binding domain-containing protein [Treponema sp.]